MIRRLGSDLASFKSLTLKAGLNILLVDKSEGATDRQSRNGAGKTSFVELVHFLFGADVRKENIFRSDALNDWTFDVAVDIGGGTVSAARSGAKPSCLLVNGDVSGWPLPPSLNERIGLYEVPNEAWKANLGALWFGLPLASGDETERFQPSFRSLFSYFARRQQSGGFQQPMQHSSMQQSWVSRSRSAICSVWIGRSRASFRNCAAGRRSPRNFARQRAVRIWAASLVSSGPAHAPDRRRGTRHPITRPARQFSGRARVQGT
jgi:uncharacterized protein YydD (DUF2326 family)